MGDQKRVGKLLSQVGVWCPDVFAFWNGMGSATRLNTLYFDANDKVEISGRDAGGRTNGRVYVRYSTISVDTREWVVSPRSVGLGFLLDGWL